MFTRSIVVGAVLYAFASVPAGVLAQSPTGGPDRGGFTLLASVGVGYQDDKALADAETGLAGINLGIGGFLKNDLALWFRVSGTSAEYGPFMQTSGVGVAGVQYWVNDRFNVEGGAGVGFWTIEDANESGFGFLLGAGYSLFNRGKHSLQLGLEYAPAFTSPEMVHNVGLTLGYQLL